MTESNSNSQFQKIAVRVSLVTILINLALSVLKLVAGLLAHSEAMISDSVHSASDVFSTIVVIIGIRIAAKEGDAEHPYGHERLESVAAILLAMILALTGIGIGANACRIIALKDNAAIQIPGTLALISAILSILVKEIMFWYTRHYARIIDSGALMADAWHHRSDALSSVGALVGIAGARMGYPVLDPVASIIICMFILKAAFDIFMDAIDKLVDHACDEETTQALKDVISSVDGVLGIDLLRTRIFGNRIYVDLEIRADGDKPLRETHATAEQVHDAIEEAFPKVKHIMVHVNPN